MKKFTLVLTLCSFVFAESACSVYKASTQPPQLIFKASVLARQGKSSFFGWVRRNSAIPTLKGKSRIPSNSNRVCTKAQNPELFSTWRRIFLPSAWPSSYCGLWR